ncbi:nuclear transport factor 2 family protein [Nonomuraea sp. NPDC050556]|uniref:nuclear transport factor 2 family protein n=1 Tax=Nonomuraea sp. NPDC050556 TaxID=3364369 RepID=UPI00378DE4E8
MDFADLLARYAYAIDSGDWDALDDVFTPTATIDYTSAGGIVGPYPEVKKWLAEVLPHWPGRMHLIGAMTVSHADGEALVKAAFTDALSPSRALVSEGVIQGGGWYHHTLVRTPEGWRSRRLVEEQTWRLMLPGRG